jgi:hypothetical protein
MTVESKKPVSHEQNISPHKNIILPATKLTFRPSQNKHITFACGFLYLGYLLVGIATVGSCLGWLRSATCVFS